MIAVDDGRALLAEWLHGGVTPELRERTGRYLDGTEPVAECTECGQDVPIQLGATAESSQINLRTLLKAVASGAVTPEDAARLIESWPAPGGAS